MLQYSITIGSLREDYTIRVGRTVAVVSVSMDKLLGAIEQLQVLPLLARELHLCQTIQRSGQLFNNENILELYNLHSSSPRFRHSEQRTGRVSYIYSNE